MDLLIDGQLVLRDNCINIVKYNEEGFDEVKYIVYNYENDGELNPVWVTETLFEEMDDALDSFDVCEEI